MTRRHRVSLTVFGACVAAALAVAEPGGAAAGGPALSNRTVNLFFDLLVQQMGQAHADGITQGSAGPVTTVTAGDGITRTYTITVSNEDSSMATGVTVTDTWPSGFTLGTLTSSQGSCTPDGGNFTCALGNLAAGGSATISASYTVPATTPAGSQTNTVSVTSNTPSPSSSNYTASKTMTVVTSADLSVTQSDGVTSITAGDGITRTYTITVSNEGPSMAASVTLTDTWPSGFTLGNLTSSQGSCTPDGGNFTCALGNLAAGASATISASYTVPATTPAGSQTNTVSVTSNAPSPSSSNNTANKTTTVLKK
jgi:uncharacterized repeat protein (TIGR01451 family)